MITALVVAVVVGGVAFWGGMTYAQSKAPSPRAGQFGQAGAGARGGFRGGANAAFGTIIAKDSNSITVQLGGPNASSTNGSASGTKIVLYDTSTQVGKMVAGSATDLSIGASVTADGSANSDGSITAQMIQIRPAGAGPRGLQQ